MTRATTPMRERERERERDRTRDRSRGRDKEKGKKREKKEDIGPPGAGTLYVYGVDDEPLPRSRSGGRYRSRERAQTSTEPSSWEQCTRIRHEPCRSRSPDALLMRGIETYRFLPAAEGGVLGRGKFSTVYKVTDTEGKDYALKHTALHPHHPLIAARLLREPTLLAQVPIHPCLVGVHGSIRTAGHFYLIEQYAASHIPLSSHPTRLKPSRAAYILDQLVSVTRDCLHSGGRVVHRDLKGDNILIDEDTGDLLLLDLGLATHYSASEPKLTTCCGSPAFHSPEIVTALNHPPGEISYYGPELDIWCIALTVLSLLLDVKYPIGPSHKSIHVMRDRVLDRLQEIDELYPPSAPCKYVAPELSDEDKAVEVQAWKKVRKALRDFLEIDGTKRMWHFDAYDVGEETRRRVEQHGRDGQEGFKTLSFLPTDVKHTLPLYMEHDPAGAVAGPITLSNPTAVSERKVLSYVKYILRSRGVLYHCLSSAHSVHSTNNSDTDSSGSNVHGEPTNRDTDRERYTMIQLVLPCPPPSHDYLADPPAAEETRKESPASWVSSLFSGPKRAASVPPHLANHRRSPSRTPGNKGRDGGGEYSWYLKCWARIEVEKPVRPSLSRMPSSRRSSTDTSVTSTATATTTSPALPVSPVHMHGMPLNPILGQVSPLTTLQEGVPDVPAPAEVASPVDNQPRRPNPPSRAHSVDGQRRTPTGLSPSAHRTASTSRLPRRPHPLSRQVSLERPAPATVTSSATLVPPPRVTITLSDPRGYGVLRTVLDVKHMPTDAASACSPLSSTGATLAAPEPIVGVKEVGSDQSEEERGRPRSKDDSKVLVLERGRVEVVAPKPTHARPQSRGRKIGFFEGWFGIGGDSGTSVPARSSSSPPGPTTSVEMRA